MKIIKIISVFLALAALLLTSCGNMETKAAGGVEISPAESLTSSVLPENCRHGDWSNEHICKICGYRCMHEQWRDGICTLCGAICEHSKWDEGICAVCGYNCDHPSHDSETRQCSVCGVKVWHSFINGRCACGAVPDIRTEILSPKEYFIECEHAGKLERLSYQAPYYPSNGEYMLNKDMLVYLPYDYDESKQYDVLLLISGQHGHAEDFFTNVLDYDGPFPKVQGVYLFDYIFENKIAKPTILVAINTRAAVRSARLTDTLPEQIGPELRNDILPCIIEHYSTYAEDSSPESISAARQHFGISGFSNGAIYAYRNGFLENFDLFGNFMCMSGSNSSGKIAEIINGEEWGDLPIYYYFAGAGTLDIRLLNSMHGYQNIVNNTERLIEGENAMLVNINGGHKWCVWFTGLYDALQVMFPEI